MPRANYFFFAFSCLVASSAFTAAAFAFATASSQPFRAGPTQLFVAESHFWQSYEQGIGAAGAGTGSDAAIAATLEQTFMGAPMHDCDIGFQLWQLYGHGFGGGGGH